MNITHNGTVVTYDEQSNKWLFELRGRDRSAESLAKAKEMIDKPITGAKAFEKIPAWFFRFNNEPKRVTITGIADVDYAGKLTAWINSDKDKRRSKERIDYALYPMSDRNNKVAESIISKIKEREKLTAEIEDLKATLEPLKLEIPE